MAQLPECVLYLGGTRCESFPFLENPVSARSFILLRLSPVWGDAIFQFEECTTAPTIKSQVRSLANITITRDVYHLKLKTLSVVEFDDYYTSLRPRMNELNCNASSGINLPHPDDPSLTINCRNVWFREFWSQHNKCSFSNNTERPCTGNESIEGYEQEGLVPFVGEYKFFPMSCSQIRATCCFLASETKPPLFL